MKVAFTVLGEPKGKQRPRMTKEGRAYTPKETVQYENLIRMEYRRQCNDFNFGREVALDARIIAYYAIPKSASKRKQKEMLEHKIRPLKKVDCDNLVKVVLDSLNKIAYHDDVQVVDCQVRKFYSDSPRIAVSIREAALWP